MHKALKSRLIPLSSPVIFCSYNTRQHYRKKHCYTDNNKKYYNLFAMFSNGGSFANEIISFFFCFFLFSGKVNLITKTLDNGKHWDELSITL